MKKTLLLLFLAASMVASAQMIGATNSQGTYRPAGDNYNLRPTGSLLRFSVGSPMFSVAFGYQVKPWLMVGAGAGYNKANIDRKQEYYDKPANSWDWILRDNYTNVDKRWGYNDCIPLYLETEARTPGYKWSVFLNAKVGFNILFNNLSVYDSVYDSRESYTVTYAESIYGAIREEYTVKYVYFSVMAGASYKNLDLGIGYTNAEALLSFGDCFYLNLSYNIPIATLRKVLMF